MTEPGEILADVTVWLEKTGLLLDKQMRYLRQEHQGVIK
jgi:hypothetical protein